MTLNTSKTVSILFKAKTIKKEPTHLKIDSSYITFVDNVKFLGVWIDHELNWKVHTCKLILKIQKNAHLLFKTKRYFSFHAKKILYFAQIYSHIAYSLSIWGPMATKKDIKKLQPLQMKCLQCITSNHMTNFLLFENLIKLELAKFGWKVTNDLLPTALQECAQTNQFGNTLIKSHRYTTGNKGIPNIPHTVCKQYTNSLFCKSISFFYTLPLELKNINNYNIFCNRINKYLLPIHPF